MFFNLLDLIISITVWGIALLLFLLKDQICRLPLIHECLVLAGHNLIRYCGVAMGQSVLQLLAVPTLLCCLVFALGRGHSQEVTALFGL